MAQYRATSDTLGITWGKARTVLEAVCRSAALQAEEVGAASRLTTLGSTPADCAFIIGTLIFLCLAAFLDSAFRSENVAAAIVALIGASVSAYFLKTTRAAESSELSTRLSVIADKFNEACSNDDADTSGLQFSQMHALRHGSPLTSVVPVYRNGQWHRVPTLLLVESDLIALATSDVAPGAAIEYLAQSDSSATPRPIVLAKGDLVPEKDYARSRTLGEIDTFLDLCGQVRCFRMQETPAKEYLKRITSSLAEERDLHQSPLAEVHLRKLASLLYRCKLVIAVVVFFVCVLRFIIERRPNEWVYYLIIRPAAAMTVVLFPSLPVLVTFIEMIASAQLIECSERSRIATTSKPKEVNLFEAIFGWILQSGLCSLKRVISQRLGKSTFSQLALRSWLVGDAWNPEQSPVPLRSSKLVERLGIVTMLSVVDEEVIFEPFSVPETVFFKGASSSKSLKFYQSGSGFGFEDPSWWQCMTSLKPIGLCAMVVATKMGNIEVEDEEVNVLNRESQTRMREALVKHIRRSPPAEHGSLSGSDFSRDDQHHVDLALEIGFSNEDLSLFVEKRRVHVLNRSNRRGLAADPDSPDDTYSQEDSWRRGYVHPAMTSAVIEDRRSSALQLMSVGEVRRILSNCTEYWDGADIMPLVDDVRKSLLDTHQQWNLADCDATAFAYTPIPSSAETVLREEHDDIFVEMNSSQNGIPHAGRTPNLASAPSTAMSLMKNQIFLGMVGSRIPLKSGIRNDVEESMAARIRFVFFSPRNMRRSKAIADKLGLETDWNCAISLQAVEDSNAPSWSVKAQMPHGVEAIRKHIEEVDNVPLLVSMMTDSTPPLVSSMFQIYQEYGETCLCIGTAYRASNIDLFASADVAFASCGVLPGGQKPESLLSYAPVQISSADIDLNERLVSLLCALNLKGSEEESQISSATTLVREGRRILSNIYQVVSFTLCVTGTLIVAVILSQISPVSSPPFLPSISVIILQVLLTVFVALPMLASEAHPSLREQTASKNNPNETIDMQSFIFQFIGRTLPTGFLGTLLHIWALGVYIVETFPNAASSCAPHDSNEPSWYDVIWCKKFESHNAKEIVAAQRNSSALIMFFLALSICVQSSSFLYRTHSVLMHSPLKNLAWVCGVLVTMSVQSLIFILSIDYFTWIPWQMWLAIFLWPVVLLVLTENINAYDAQTYDRYMKFLQLEFDTRLGMYSPR